MNDPFESYKCIDVNTFQFVDLRLWEHTRPGFWNDLDMLEVGNGDLSHNENVAHMILWCAFKSPLILGNDVRYL